MPIRHALWTVGTDPQPVRTDALPDERTLEDMIATRPEILSNEWMLIGRQVRTAHGGIVDLLAIAPDGGSFGHDVRRDWNEAREHGFVSAGGGPWYSGSLGRLSIGDRVWVRVPKKGYVGVGIVEGLRVPLRDHVIDGRPAPEVLKTVPPDTYQDDPERWDYVVPVRWLGTVPLDRAVHRTGMFANQNSAAAPRTPNWRATVEQLKEAFPAWDAAPRT